MKKDDIGLIVAVAIIAGIIAFVVSTALFKYNQTANAVPVVETVSSTLPDPYNDPTYKAIFNSNAIDPTQLIHIGSQNNSQPFRGTQ